jgi:hypothetical protein
MNMSRPSLPSSRNNPGPMNRPMGAARCTSAHVVAPHLSKLSLKPRLYSTPQQQTIVNPTGSPDSRCRFYIDPNSPKYTTVSIIVLRYTGFGFSLLTSGNLWSRARSTWNRESKRTCSATGTETPLRKKALSWW